MSISYAAPTITVTGGKESGTCPTSGSHTPTNIVVPSGGGGSNAYARRFVWIHTGTNAGQRRYITASTATSLTVTPALLAACDNTSQFIVSHNLADIQAANDSGAWGVVTTANTHTRIAADLKTGDGTNRTYFGDVEKMLTVKFPTISSGSNLDYFRVTNLAVQQFGYLDANSNEVGGCQIVIDGTQVSFTGAAGVSLIGLTSSASTGNVYWSDCRYTYLRNTADANATFAGFIRLYSDAEFRRVNFSKHGGGRIYGVGSVFSKVTAHEGWAQAWGAAASLTTPLTDLEFYNENYAVKNGDNYTMELRRPVFRNNTYIALLQGVTGLTYTGVLNLFDANVQLVANDIYLGANVTSATGFVDEYKSYNATVADAGGTAVSGVRIRIANAAGTEVFNNTTSGSGTITQQDLKYARWTGPGAYDGIGRAGQFTKTSYTPFSFRFRKYGYVFQAVSKAVGAAPIADSVTMASNAFVVASDATATAYTGVSINGSAKTITLSGARTVQEMYDYSQAWADDSGNIQYDECMTTVDGSTFSLASGWVLSATENLTYSGKRITGGTITLGTVGTYSPVLGTTTLRFTAAGSYNLAGINATGTITLTNTSGSPVTVELTSGVTYVNTGPNITVNTPSVYASATVLANSRVQLYNVTTATEIENVFVTGTSYSKAITTQASNGDTLRMRVCKKGRMGAELFAVWSSASGSAFLVSQPEDTVYTAWGIDGDTVTEYSLDGPNLQIDANDVDGATTKTRLGAFYSAALASSTSGVGIRYFYGALTFLSTAAIRVNTSIANLFVENTNATTALRFTDLDVRLYKDDGTTIIAPTSYSIHNDYSGVPDVVETGVSGLTGAESAQLMGLPSAAATATAVLAAADATPIAADIQQVRGSAISGTGTEANPWGP